MHLESMNGTWERPQGVSGPYCVRMVLSKVGESHDLISRLLGQQHPPSAVQHWERGGHPPPEICDTLMQISQFLEWCIRCRLNGDKSISEWMEQTRYPDLDNLTPLQLITSGQMPRLYYYAQLFG